MDNRLIYKAFGLNWFSDCLSIPELYETKEKKVDISIHLELSTFQPSDWFLKVKDDQIEMNIRDLANFRMEGGNKITIKSKNKNNDDALRTYLLGSVMGGILIQRGILLLHANALEKSGKVIVCAGEKGVGKSTISYILMSNGWKLLSDDLVAINENGIVLPGIPRIKLFKGVIEGLNLNINKFRHLYFNEDKYVIDKENVNPSFAFEKLSEIFFLEKNSKYKSNIINKPVEVNSESEKFFCLSKNLFRPKMINDRKTQEKYFLKLAELAKNIPAKTINVPENLTELKSVIRSYLQ